MRKSLFFLATLAVLMALSACGGDEEENQNPAQPEPSEPSEPAGIAVRLPEHLPFPPVCFIDEKARLNKFSVPDAEEADASGFRPFITYVGPQNFQEEVLDTKYPVMVDFFATWCGPCKFIGPYVKDLAKLYPKIKFVKYDMDQSGNIPAAYNVSGIPAFRFFYLGKEYKQYAFSGAFPKTLVYNVDSFFKEVQASPQGN